MPNIAGIVLKTAASLYERTLEEIVESNLKFLDKFNAENGTDYTADDARSMLKLHLAALKRWNGVEI